MKKIVAVAALAAVSGFALSGHAHAAGLFGFKSQLKNPPPPVNYQGQWYTTPDGCSYSRAKAPGYAPTWHLIINPHHIGQPNARKSCPAMLSS